MGTAVIRIFITFSLSLLMVKPAFANQPPGGQMMLAEISILPLMALFTAIGGGYELKEQFNGKDIKGKSTIKVILIFIIFLFSMAHEMFSVLGTIAFGFLAIRRSIALIKWGIQQHGVPTRLIASGSLLALITCFLVGGAVAFLGYFPQGSKYEMERLKRFTAYQIALARRTKDQAGNPQFIYRPNNFETVNFLQSAGNTIDFAHDGKGFTILQLPKRKLPFFPYNFLTAYPSFRADQTGQIRMIMVNNENIICPSDAQVVSKVEESDIKNQDEKIEKFGIN